MKIVIFGGVISLIGTVLSLFIANIPIRYLIYNWQNPAELFVKFINQMNLLSYLYITITIAIIGIVIMIIGILKKN